MRALRPSAARRLAAMAAMAALVAAAVLLLVGIATHLAGVVLAFVSLLIGVTGGWYAVSRRGVVRVIAVVVAVASVAAFGTGLFFADISIWQVILIAALGGVSVLAARYALKRTRRQLRAETAHLAKAERPHVCVPAGTRNHFALDLGLDRSDVVGALDAFTDGVERRIDLAAVNGRTFVNNASLGLYAEVVQSPGYRDAKVKTAAAILPDLLGPDTAPLELRYTGPDGQRHPTAQLILVSNDPYQLDYPGGRGTRARIDQGVLGIMAVMIADADDARKFAALEAAGQVRRFPGWAEWSAPRFEVGSGAPVQIGLDGEALTMNPPLVFISRPGALRIRLPRHALPRFACGEDGARAFRLHHRGTRPGRRRRARHGLALWFKGDRRPWCARAGCGTSPRSSGTPSAGGSPRWTGSGTAARRCPGCCRPG